VSVLLPNYFRKAIREPAVGAVLPVDDLFPNAPGTAGWTTVTDLRWDEAPIGNLPVYSNPTYDADDGGHIVNYTDNNFATVGYCASRVADATVPGGVGRALLCTFPTSLVGGYSSVKLYRHPTYSGTGPLEWPSVLCTGYIYIGVYVRFGSGFTQNGNVAQKLIGLGGSGNSTNHVPINFRPPASYTPPGEGQYIEFTPQDPFGNYGPARTNNLNDGDWHLIEVEATPGTPGTANASITIWEDDVQTYTTAAATLFNSDDTPNYNAAPIIPIYGGGTNSPPSTLSMYVGPMHVRVK
jgi:hypothetical protein